MLWHFIGVCALASLWLLPAQLDAFVAHSTGCHHNGTWYADKSLVPTMEKCLNCQCNRKTLVCRLKVCPEMPMPPPRGCVVVQKKNTCCPYLSCARLDAFYKIPITRRIIQYLDHYERESIDRVVNENMLQRRSDDSEVDTHVCVKNGTVYKSGSAMSSSNLCTYCYCIGGSEKCVKPKCMLPVEGCKPIFVDSTCCPVRYDCSKPSGKSSQEVRYRKNSNKHFLRMSQRLQRNRGCSTADQYYAEGQKMKSNADRPCDICFCIRGIRRCAPKKCSPALKNCIPVVPKGQCCPSSYDCGSQRDYRRAESSRQFNLYSLLFGKDEDGAGNATDIPEHYPHDRHPSVTAPHTQNKQPVADSANEKSIFDTIREGLEFIDSNNDKLLEENLELMAETPGMPLKTKVVLSPPLPPPPPKKENPSTEVSFLDLILGPAEKPNPTKKVQPQPIPAEQTTPGLQQVSWMDLLLGADEDEDKSAGSTTLTGKLDLTETTTDNQQTDYSVGTTSIDRVADNFEDYAGSDEILVANSLEQQQQSHSTAATTETAAESTIETSTLKTSPETTDYASMEQLVETTERLEEEHSESTTETTTSTERVLPKVQSTIKPKLPSKSTATTNRLTTTTTASKPVTTTTTTTPQPIRTTTLRIPTTVSSTQKPIRPLQKTDATPNSPPKNDTTHKPQKKPGLLTALIDGLSDMLSGESAHNQTTLKSQNNSTLKPTTPAAAMSSSTTPRTKQPTHTVTPTTTPLFKPLPTVKPHTRINSKITNITTSSSLLASRPHTTFKPASADLTKQPTISTTKSKATTTPSNAANTSNTITTVKPLVIKTNPNILEAEPLDKNAAHTLPPSLPNLKIIPFLPTDAVEPDRNNYSKHPQTSRIDYDLYDEANLYPAITERYPTYAQADDDSKAEYIYKFKVEGPAPPVTSTSVKLDGTVGSTAFAKYDFDVVNGVPSNGFSPPTKTEGGFVPKEPFVIEDEQADSESLNYQVTQHIIDITTAEPMRDNTTKIIEITTPDPFKDVIKTETPPDLNSLIEDKENFLHTLENAPIASKTQRQTTTAKPKVGYAPVKATHRPQPSSGDFSFSSNFSTTNKSENAKNQENKNSIESLLDLLFKEEEEDEQLTNLQHAVASAASTLPPFKTLPVALIQQVPVELTSTKPSKTTTLSKTATTKPTVKVTRTKMPATTPRIKSRPVAPTANFAAKSSTTNAPASTTKTTKTKISTTRHTAVTRTTLRAPVSTTTTATPTSSIPSTTKPTSSTGHRTHLMSPFDKLPFMNTSYEIKPNPLPPPAPSRQSNEDNLLDLLDYKNSLNRFEGLEPAYERYPFHSPTSSSTTTTTTSTSAPQHSSLSAQHSATNSLIDPTGMLKLAGCNIYGRMYRVGRIILELSSACLECKCTEVGVKCGPLDC